jgi:hypothetical protein
MHAPKGRLALSLAVAVVLAGSTAVASERDRAEADTARRTVEERTFVFGVDPSTPSLGVVTAESSLGLGSGVAALRPLPAASDARAPEASLSMSVGLGGGFAPFVTGVRAFGEGASSAPGGVGVVAGLRWQITEAHAPLRVGLVGAAFREPGGAYGMSLRAAVSYDVDRLRIGSNLLAERAFRGARDALDVVVSAGASFRVLPGLRLGAEYVGQDLEELGGAGAEGGPKQYAGPTTAIELDRDRVQIVTNPTIDLKTNSTQ